MEALRGMSEGEEGWSGVMSWMMVSVRASSWHDWREVLQVRRRAMVAGVRADICSALYSCLLYVYCSDGGMQASRAGWGLVVGSQGGGWGDCFRVHA